MKELKSITIKNEGYKEKTLIDKIRYLTIKDLLFIKYNKELEEELGKESFNKLLIKVNEKLKYRIKLLREVLKQNKELREWMN